MLPQASNRVLRFGRDEHSGEVQLPFLFAGVVHFVIVTKSSMHTRPHIPFDPRPRQGGQDVLVEGFPGSRSPTHTSNPIFASARPRRMIWLLSLPSGSFSRHGMDPQPNSKPPLGC